MPEFYTGITSVLPGYGTGCNRERSKDRTWLIDRILRAMTGLADQAEL